jgi:hypothetical protein
MELSSIILLRTNNIKYEAKGINMKTWDKIDYSDYLQTSHWKKQRIMVLEKKGNKCIICDSLKKINIHHKRYKDSKGSILFRENLRDLFPLCSSCHTLWHQIHNKTHLNLGHIRRIQALLLLGGKKRDAFIIATNKIKFRSILKQYEEYLKRMA